MGSSPPVDHSRVACAGVLCDCMGHRGLRVMCYHTKLVQQPLLAELCEHTQGEMRKQGAK